MKIDKRKSITNNSKVYIRLERENLLSKFWNEYKLANKKTCNEWEISIFNFFGVGGTGKTELVNDLYNQLNDSKQCIIKVFDENQSILENILCVRNILVSQYKADFSLFDLVYCEYCKKMGRSLSEFEKKSLFSNKIIESIYPILNVIPNLNLLAAIPQCLKPYEQEIRKKFSENSFQFVYYSYVELEKRLPQYFAEDFQKFLLKENKVFTLIIDNIDWISGEDRILFENWFLKEGSLTHSLPNIIWVFAQRERIKDTFFPDKTVQNIKVGNFDKDQTEIYLKGLNIREEYFDDIYALTSGLPLYLELCKETYYACIKNKQAFNIDILGKEKENLVHTFYRYMGEEHKKVLRIMSYLVSWTDSIFTELLRYMNIENCNVAYEEVKNMSFIHVGQERYYIHDIVGEVIETQLTKSELELVSSYINTKYDETERLTFDLKKNMISIVNEKEFEKYILEEIFSILFFYAEQGKSYEILRCRRILMEKSADFKDANFSYAIIDWCCAKAYVTLGEFEKSLLYSKSAYEKLSYYILSFEKDNGFNGQIYISIKEHYANDLQQCGNYEESLKIRSEIWSESKRLYGKDSFQSIVCEHNFYLSLLEDETTQLEGINKIIRIIKKREKFICGGEIDKTNLQHIINAKITLGRVYASRGDYENAVKWGQEAAILAYDTFWKKIEGVEEDVIAITEKNYAEKIIFSFAEILMDIREFKSMVSLLEEIYSSWIKIFDEKSQIMMSLTYCLGVAYGEVGRPEKGKELLRKCYEYSYDTRGKYDKKTLRYRKEYAICLAYAGEDDESLATLEECLFAYLEVYGDDNSKQLEFLRHAIMVQKKKLSLRY